MKLLRISAVLFLFLGVASLANAQTTADLPRGNVSGFGSFALSASDYDAFINEQRELSERGEYFWSTTRFVYVGKCKIG